MKRNSIIIVIGGAALIALSFLLGSLTHSDSVRYILLALGAIAVAVGITAFVMLSRVKKKHYSAEYVKKSSLMTPTETRFFGLLRNLMGRRYEVFPQMALGAVIDKPNAPFRSELFRIADFCIADAETYEPLLLIELNDASHVLGDRALRDEKVRELCYTARLPLIAFDLNEATDERLVFARIKKAIKQR